MSNQVRLARYFKDDHIDQQQPVLFSNKKGALNKNLEECAYYAAFWKRGFSSSAAPNDDICTKMGRIAGSLWK
jgi:hypothetical protein